MERIYQNLLNNLLEAKRNIQNTGHMIYITFPVVKNPKLLLNALEDLSNITIKLLTTILHFEYLHGKIALTKDAATNLNTFFSKSASRYSLTLQDITTIKQILYLKRKYKESNFEYTKDGKVILMDKTLQIEEISLDKIHEFIEMTNKLCENSLITFKSSLQKGI